MVTASFGCSSCAGYVRAGCACGMTNSFAARQTSGASAIPVNIAAQRRTLRHSRNMMVDYRMRSVSAMVPYPVPMRLECPFPYVLAVQLTARDRFSNQHPLLGFSNAAPRQVRLWFGRAAGKSGGPAGGTANWGGQLGPCPFFWGGAGGGCDFFLAPPHNFP